MAQPQTGGQMLWKLEGNERVLHLRRSRSIEPIQIWTSPFLLSTSCVKEGIGAVNSQQASRRKLHPVYFKRVYSCDFSA
jgi:hypothetical protein